MRKKTDNPQDIWENKEEGIVSAADSKRVVLGNYYSRVKAVDPDSGELLWTSDIRGLVAEGKDKSILVSGPDKFITGLNGDTGTVSWKKEFPAKVEIFDVADDGTIYASSPGKIYALDPKTHEITGECQVFGKPAVGKNGMIFSGGPDAYKVAAYDFKTGEKKWEIVPEGMVRCAPAVGKDGTVYVGMEVSNSMVALDPDTGKEKWTFKAGGNIAISPAVGPDGTVYLGDCGKPSHLYAIDPDTGKEKWRFQGKDDFRSGIDFLPDGTVVAPTDCDANAINPHTGSLLWSKKGKSYLQAPPIAGTEGRLYMGTNGKGMHCFRDPLIPEDELTENPAGGESPDDKNLQITSGKGFIDIGGVRLKVNE